MAAPLESAAMLRFSDLAIRRGPRLLFEHVDMQVHAGWKIGLTGGNGTGKSSLFALIRDQLHADAGSFHKPADWQIAHVAQETPASERPAIDYVIDGDAELRRVEADLEEAEARHDGHAPLNCTPICTTSAATKRAPAPPA